MGVQFIVGRAGQGKSAWCRQRIIEACKSDPLGRSIFLIVPRQVTFQTERELVCASDLGAVFRARVTSFDLLGREVLAERGGDAVPEIDALGRRIILGYLLRQHADELTYFKSVARQVGLAGRLDRTLGELERAGRSIDDVAAMVESSEYGLTDEGSLLDKVHDLKVIFNAYTAYLGQDRLDPHRRLRQVLESIDQYSALQGAQVYIDSFEQFTDFEQHAIARLAAVCKQVNITALMDPASMVLRSVHSFPSELSAFFPSEMGYRRLRLFLQQQGVELGATIALSGSERDKARGLGEIDRIEKYLFSEQTPESDILSIDQKSLKQAVDFIEAASPLEEAQAVAQRICELMAEGVRLREMVVLVRDLSSYLDVIDIAFRQRGLSYFADRRRPVAHHPLIQLLRSAMEVAVERWSSTACMGLVKNELCSLSHEQMDRLENYCLAYGVSGEQAWLGDEPWIDPSQNGDGRPDKAALHGKTVQDELSSAGRGTDDIDTLRRRIAAPMREFVRAVTDEGCSVRQIITAIYRLFDDYAVRRTVARWMKQAADAGHAEAQSEHQQTWEVLSRLADQMVQLLGDEPVGLPEFANILENALDSFDLALTPQTVDQVLVGSVERTLISRLKVTIVMGLNAGMFPRSSDEDLVLTDNDRYVLSRNKIDIGSSSRRRVLDENFLAYRALTRASEYLVLTRPAADEQGRAVAPSSYWLRARQILAKATPDKLQMADPAMRVRTIQELAAHLVDWVRTGEKGSASDSTNTALYQWVMNEIARGNPLVAAFGDTWRALKYDNTARIEPGTARQLWGQPLNVTASQIESFASCPFQHFAKYGLKLTERRDAGEDEYVAARIGSRVLDKLVVRLRQLKQDWPELDDEAEARQIDQLTRQVARELMARTSQGTARQKYLFNFARRSLLQVGQNQRAQMEGRKFRPLRSNVFFDEVSELGAYEIKTPKHRVVHLSARMDRVDVIDMDEMLYAAAIKYRSGEPYGLIPGAYHRLALELLSFLVVLKHNGRQLMNRELTPIGAFYLKIRRDIENKPNPEDAPTSQDVEFRLNNKLRGIVDGDAVPLFDKLQADGTVEPTTASEVLNVKTGNTGALYANKDSLDHAIFAKLIDYAESAIAQTADEILDGQIAVKPYRLGDVSPCSRCAFRSVCRFDPMVDGYRFLESVNRKEAIERITGGPGYE